MTFNSIVDYLTLKSGEVALVHEYFQFYSRLSYDVLTVVWTPVIVIFQFYSRLSLSFPLDIIYEPQYFFQFYSRLSDRREKGEKRLGLHPFNSIVDYLRLAYRPGLTANLFFQFYSRLSGSSGVDMDILLQRFFQFYSRLSQLECGARCKDIIKLSIL